MGSELHQLLLNSSVITFVILASGLAVLEYSLFPLVINLKNTNTGVKGLSQMCQARRRAEELAALPEVPSLPVPARRPSWYHLVTASRDALLFPFCCWWWLLGASVARI